MFDRITDDIAETENVGETEIVLDGNRDCEVVGELIELMNMVGNEGGGVEWRTGRWIGGGEKEKRRELKK